jgi:hypothetical protein
VVFLLLLALWVLVVEGLVVPIFLDLEAEFLAGFCYLVVYLFFKV